MKEARPKDVPGVVTAPVVIYAAPLLAGLLYDWRKPGLLPKKVACPLGLGLAGTGTILGLQAAWQFRRAGTSLEPWEPTTALVAGGVYRYTRNPVYLGFACIYAGIALMASSCTALYLLPAVVALINRGVIEREERYLEDKFGDQYRTYAQKARRWI
jgi:protein-S-isoprenylcysteine O-methyltransferase Ste14